MDDNAALRTHARLKDALKVKRKDVVCLVGAGGKTTIMFRLAKELARDDACVITTTTTRIMAPSPVETEALAVESGKTLLLNKVASMIESHRHITVVSNWDGHFKVEGIDSDMVVSLAELEGVSHIIIEADGAARRPLKAPKHYEPVRSPRLTLIDSHPIP